MRYPAKWVSSLCVMVAIVLSLLPYILWQGYRTEDTTPPPAPYNTTHETWFFGDTSSLQSYVATQGAAQIIFLRFAAPQGGGHTSNNSAAAQAWGEAQQHFALPPPHSDHVYGHTPLKATFLSVDVETPNGAYIAKHYKVTAIPAVVGLRGGTVSRPPKIFSSGAERIEILLKYMECGAMVSCPVNLYLTPPDGEWTAKQKERLAEIQDTFRGRSLLFAVPSVNSTPPSGWWSAATPPALATPSTSLCADSTSRHIILTNTYLDAGCFEVRIIPEDEYRTILGVNAENIVMKAQSATLLGGLLGTAVPSYESWPYTKLLFILPAASLPEEALALLQEAAEYVDVNKLPVKIAFMTHAENAAIHVRHFLGTLTPYHNGVPLSFPLLFAEVKDNRTDTPHVSYVKEVEAAEGFRAHGANVVIDFMDEVLDPMRRAGLGRFVKVSPVRDERHALRFVNSVETGVVLRCMKLPRVAEECAGLGVGRSDAVLLVAYHAWSSRSQAVVTFLNTSLPSRLEAWQTARQKNNALPSSSLPPLLRILLATQAYAINVETDTMPATIHAHTFPTILFSPRQDEAEDKASVVKPYFGDLTLCSVARYVAAELNVEMEEGCAEADAKVDEEEEERALAAVVSPLRRVLDIARSEAFEGRAELGGFSWFAALVTVLVVLPAVGGGCYVLYADMSDAFTTWRTARRVRTLLAHHRPHMPQTEIETLLDENLGAEGLLLERLEKQCAEGKVKQQ